MTMTNAVTEGLVKVVDLNIPILLTAAGDILLKRGMSVEVSSVVNAIGGEPCISCSGQP